MSVYIFVLLFFEYISVMYSFLKPSTQFTNLSSQSLNPGWCPGGKINLIWNSLCIFLEEWNGPLESHGVGAPGPYIRHLREASSESWGCWMILRLKCYSLSSKRHTWMCVDCHGLWCTSQLDDQDRLDGMVCWGDGIGTGMAMDRGGVSIWLYWGPSLPVDAIVCLWSVSTLTGMVCIPQFAKPFTDHGVWAPENYFKFLPLM